MLSMSSLQTINRPNFLGDVNAKEDHVVSSPSSSRTPTMPRSSHSSIRSVDVKSRHRLPQWMVDMPVKDQKRLNGVWLQVMGETEMPDDKHTVMETVAKFEAQSASASHQRRPVPRRVAPPPPTVDVLRRAAELEDELRRNDDVCLRTKETKELSSVASDSASLKTVQSAGSTPNEKVVFIFQVSIHFSFRSLFQFDSTAVKRPVPKPRRKVRESQCSMFICLD